MTITKQDTELARQLIPEFNEALELRKRAAAVPAYRPASKIELAEKALDKMEYVLAYLILRAQQVQ